MHKIPQEASCEVVNRDISQFEAIWVYIWPQEDHFFHCGYWCDRIVRGPEDEEQPQPPLLPLINDDDDVVDDDNNNINNNDDDNDCGHDDKWISKSTACGTNARLSGAIILLKIS